jgi:hypothetical protein
MKTLQADFINWAKNINARVEKGYAYSLGRLLKKVGIRYFNTTPKKYTMPSLEKARELFALNVIKGEVEWHDGEMNDDANFDLEAPF